MTTQAEQRNILLLIADDVGIDSLAMYNSNPMATFPSVPNIESLADNGVFFSNAYAYPTCSPTRSAILTGRYGCRTGVLSPASSDLPANEYTLPELFADQPELGYELASVGKWHLGGGVTGPNDLGGWPTFSGSLGGGMPNYTNWTKVVNGISSTETAYATRKNVDDAIEWIDAQGTTNWLMWVGFNAAHTALHKPPNEMHSYDSLSGTETDISTNSRPYFEAMIEAMDFQIGRLLDAVDTNETTIIFLGDNGTDRNVSQPPYNIRGRAKGSLYEGGTHVPMMIVGPSVVNTGRTNESAVHCADLFATMIELAGGTVPSGAGDDSRSLVPILENKNFQPLEDCILMESDDLLGSTTSGRAIRDNQYKLIRIVGRDDELYDMQNDDLEEINLLSGTLSVAESNAYSSLSEKLTTWTNTPTAETFINGYTIVDTAQPDCYNTTAIIFHPSPDQSFAGQDAQYAGNQPSYTRSDDGFTVQDNTTGLTWQWSPDVNNDGIINADDGLAWTQLFDYAQSLNATNFGGYNDWRVPTIKELYSLIDFRGIDPKIISTTADGLTPFLDTNAFHFAYGDIIASNRLIDAQYWTQTEYVSTTMQGNPTFFGVNFADGRIKGYSRDKASSYLRCVRGNTDYGTNNFTNNADGTITDHATGLMWQQNDSIGMNWEDALAYAEKLDLAGYRDWRLPNAKELQSIIDYTRSPSTTASAAIDPKFNCTPITNEGGDADFPYYWSSTTHLKQTGSTASAIYIAFGRGLGYFKNAWLDVHGAGSQRSDPKDGDPNDYPKTHGPQGDVQRVFNAARCVRASATAPETDNDADGLSDWYEWNHTSNKTAMVADADDDRDGVSNIDEQIAGTSPTASASIFIVNNLLATTNGATIQWSSELGKTYTISRSTNLVTDLFSTPIKTEITATPPENTFIDTDAPASVSFYRIEVAH